MKVIHILHSLKFSGAEIMYVDAAPIFQKKGCELTVMATATELGEYAPYFERGGYQVIHQPMPPLKNYIERIKFYDVTIKLLKREKFDVVHIHSSEAMWGLALCAWLTNVKSVYTFHSVFPTRILTYSYHVLKRWTAKQIFRCQFQTISDSVYEHELNLYHNKTTKVYNWYGADRYFQATAGEKEIARKELGISNETFVLISVGGCSPGKRHSDIIKALPLILQKIPDCLYLHLGKGNIEIEEMQLATDLKVIKQVRFCGNQTDVRKYLIASDVYLMPSRYEGIPITTIEAMACKIPAILYDVPGLRDFNKEGENSILIPEDYHLLAEKIIYLKENPQIGICLTNSAKSFVDKKFNMYSNVEQIFALYK
jgi:glycosyltransferase involved in cell wall biosynthesis